MLLQKLVEYANERMKDDLPPRLYRKKSARYIIEIDDDGRLMNPRPTDTADKNHRETRRGLPRLLPDRQRAVGIVPFLLADKADYSLGYVDTEGKPDRVAACHEAFLNLLDRCVLSTNAATVKAVRTFLGTNPLAQLILPDDFDPGATIVFRVGDLFPTDLPNVQAFWASVNDPAMKGAKVMQCLICGTKQPVLERLDEKIKGVPGGQMAGTSIISANDEAFESYGLEASYIAPTCANCGERFTKAANRLLADEGSRFYLGGAAFIYWTRDKVEFSLRSGLFEPDPETVRLLEDAVLRGSPVPGIGDTAFFAASLSGSGGRTVVRDWIDTTLWKVKEHLVRWQHRQKIVAPDGESIRYWGLWALARSTVRESRDIPSTMLPALTHAALRGSPLPWDMMYRALRRCEVEQTVTHSRAALIKLVLLSQQTSYEEGTLVQLEPNYSNPGSPAYHSGRLFAVLEEIQRRAIPGAKGRIVGRFYGTASSAPASVFGLLVDHAQHHLTKIQRDRRGFGQMQHDLEEVTAAVGNRFPPPLTPAERGIFALGYYHQRATYRSPRRPNAAGMDAQSNLASDDIVNVMNETEEDGED